MDRRGFLARVIGLVVGARATLTAVPAAPVAPVVPCGAITIPFATLPSSTYIRGPVYKIVFPRTVPTGDADPTMTQEHADESP